MEGGNLANNNVFKDSEWWPSVAVDLLDWKLGSLAKDLSMVLKQENESVFYIKAGKANLESFNFIIENTELKIKSSKPQLNKYDLSGAYPHSARNVTQEQINSAI